MKELILKQKVLKITDHYPIKDTKGNICYYVDQDFRFFGNTVNVSYADGSFAFRIEREPTIFLNYYDVIFNDNKKILISQKFKWFSISLELDSKDYNLSIDGDSIMNTIFKIKNGENIVAEIERVWFTFADEFRIRCYEQEFEEEVVAIAIAIDEIIDQKQRN